MAQVGDTITYTYSDGSSVAEDVSNVGEVVVEYCDGSGASSGTAGGRVENATIDSSAIDTLYIWVGGNTSPNYDRYAGGNTGSDTGGGSSEIAKVNTDSSDGSDEPFLVGAGGGATTASFINGSAGGGRGGTASTENGAGTPPPAGGDGGTTGTVATAGDGAIDDQNRGLVSGGTTIKGGGSPEGTTGEVKLSFNAGLSPPDPPSNLTAEVQ